MSYCSLHQQLFKKSCSHWLRCTSAFLSNRGKTTSGECVNFDANRGKFIRITKVSINFYKQNFKMRIDCLLTIPLSTSASRACITFCCPCGGILTSQCSRTDETAGLKSLTLIQKSSSPECFELVSVLCNQSGSTFDCDKSN